MRLARGLKIALVAMVILGTLCMAAPGYAWRGGHYGWRGGWGWGWWGVGPFLGAYYYPYYAYGYPYPYYGYPYYPYYRPYYYPYYPYRY